ncbi:MAG: glycosyltransferase family 4 protein [Rhodothermales bacterium]
MATQRLADLISPLQPVDCINLIEGHKGKVETRASVGTEKIRRYLRGGKRLKQHLHAHAGSTLLWTSISPQLLGHTRDMLTIYPALNATKRILALSHWGNFDRLFRSPATALSAKVLVKRLEGIVFLNKQLADKCADWLSPEQRLVIPNTIDDAVCASAEEIAEKQTNRQTNRQTDRASRQTIRLLYLSNMIESKGYWDVLKAINLLNKQGVRCKARFAGRWLRDEDNIQFEAYLKENNLTDIVEHLGPVSDRAQVKKLHLWADTFLLPTYYPTEAQPLVLLEAMNAGTPIITTAHSGIPEMLQNNVEGLFVPAQAPSSIADAVTTLTDIERWTRFSNNAYDKFNTAFSPSYVQNQWKALLARQ